MYLILKNVFFLIYMYINSYYISIYHSYLLLLNIITTYIYVMAQSNIVRVQYGEESIELSEINQIEQINQVEQINDIIVEREGI